MNEQILGLPAQFEWQPVYEGAAPQSGGARFILCGMGGSHLAASLLLLQDPSLPLSIHSDYGLPANAAGARIILSSYSGNTEEILDAGKAAVDAGLECIAITTGGALADFARANNMPLIILPSEGVEPRMAIGHALRALTLVLGNDALTQQVQEAGRALNPASLQQQGEHMGSLLANRIPLIYASSRMFPVANFWKIAFNETAKIPAFRYAMPEFCHNELSGFDAVPATQDLTSHMTAVFLSDAHDHPRNQLRMQLAHELLQERGIGSTFVTLEGSSPMHTALSGIVLGVWAASTLAHSYGVPDAETPLIAEFKSCMKKHV